MGKQAALILILAAVLNIAGCVVIAGKENGDALQNHALNIRYVETLRSTASLQGEGWREPRPEFRQTDPAVLTQLQQPNSVYADQFRVYVTDVYRSVAVINPRLFVFDRGERTASSLNLPAVPGEGSLLDPVAVAVDQTNTLYVADAFHGRVFGYDVNGTLVAVFGKAGELGKPAGLAIDRRRGRLYVADAASHQVKVFSTRGNLLNTVGDSGGPSREFTFPGAIALDHEGNLHVLDARAGNVLEYDLQGMLVRKIALAEDAAGGAVRGRSMAVDSGGNIYVVDTVRNRVVIFDRDGGWIQTWDRSGTVGSDFLSPASIFIDNADRIYIADQLNGRIQVFQYSR